MDPTGFRIAEAAASKPAELEADAAKSAELEADAAQSAELETDATKPGGKDSTIAFAGAAVAQGSFDTAFADSLVDKHKWDDLLSYLSGFMDLNDHPGLKFLILERQVLEHAHAKEGDAMGLVLGEVQHLCSRKEAIDDFIPADLSERAAKLSERALQINTSGGVDDDELSDLKTAVCDYMRLYFPTTIRFDNKKWEGTLAEFYHIYKDNTHAWHYRCLVCQWVVPASNDLVTVARNHVRCVGLQMHCGRLTANVIRRVQLSPLSEVMEDVTKKDYSKSKSGTSDSSSNKRKGEISSLSGESLYLVGKSERKLPRNMKDIVSSLIWEIVSHSTKVISILQEDKTENGFKIKRICFDHFACASKLYSMYQDARISKTPLDNKVFKEAVEGMMDVNFNKLLPLLCCSRGGRATREVVCEMDAVLCKIRELHMKRDYGLDDQLARKVS